MLLPMLAAAALVQPAVAVRPLDGTATYTRAGGFILIGGTIAGRPATLMLDNGSQRSLVDRGFAAAASLPLGAQAGTARSIGGTTPVRFTAPATLTVPGVLEAQLPLAAIDLSPLSRIAGRRIDGVIGEDVLRRSCLWIGGGILSASAACHPPPESEAFRFTGRPSLTVTDAMGRGRVTVMLDFGFHGFLSLSPAAWPRLAPAGAPTATAATAGVEGVARPIRVARLPGVRIGPLAVGAVEVEIGRQPARAGDGLLGADLLDHFGLMLNLGGGELALSPQAGRR